MIRLALCALIVWNCSLNRRRYFQPNPFPVEELTRRLSLVEEGQCKSSSASSNDFIIKLSGEREKEAGERLSEREPVKEASRETWSSTTSVIFSAQDEKWIFFCVSPLEKIRSKSGSFRPLLSLIHDLEKSDRWLSWDCERIWYCRLLNFYEEFELGIS